jgi:protein-S-isoprenylcysteine O-methyltransferase Ste14
MLSWLAAAGWSSPTTRRRSLRNEVAYRLPTLLGAILMFGLHKSWPSAEVVLWRNGRAVAWTLVTVTMCGLVLTWWARIVLGRLWSSGVARKADHSVVTTGPYRFVRHPIYSGIILAALATAGAKGNGAACLGAALIVLGLSIKARVEEAFLRDELGQAQYDAYARRVAMLVPFVR